MRSGHAASLSIGALLGEPGGGGSFAEGPEGYDRKAVRTSLSSWGLSWATWNGLIYWGFSDMVERSSKGGVSLSPSLSLSGSSVQGTWREAPLLGTLKDM